MHATAESKCHNSFSGWAEVFSSGENCMAAYILAVIQQISMKKAKAAFIENFLKHVIW